MRFEVKVVAAGVAGAADISNDLARTDITTAAFPAVEVGVVELVAVDGRQPDGVSAGVADLEFGEPSVGGGDGCLARRDHVDTLMTPAARARVTPTVDELALRWDRTVDRQRIWMPGVPRFCRFGRVSADGRWHRNQRDRRAEPDLEWRSGLSPASPARKAAPPCGRTVQTHVDVNIVVVPRPVRKYDRGVAGPKLMNVADARRCQNSVRALKAHLDIAEVCMERLVSGSPAAEFPDEGHAASTGSVVALERR